MEYQFNNGTLTVPLVENADNVPLSGHDVQFTTTDSTIISRPYSAFDEIKEPTTPQEAPLRRYFIKLEADELRRIGLSRRIGVKVRAVGADGGEGDWFEAPEAYNPPPKKPIFQMSSTVNRAYGQITPDPTETDIVNRYVWFSTTPDFVPDMSNPSLVLGTETNFNFPLAGDVFHFVRLAAIDSFGDDEFTVSDAMPVQSSPIDVEVDLGPINDRIDQIRDEFDLNGATWLANATDELSGALAGYDSRFTALADADTAEATARQVAIAEIGESTSVAISSVELKVDQVEAKTEAHDQLITAHGVNLSSHDQRITQVANANEAQQTAITQLVSDVQGAQANITDEATTRATADSALSQTINNLSTTVGTNKSAFDNHVVVQSNLWSANATQLTQLTAKAERQASGTGTTLPAAGAGQLTGDLFLKTNENNKLYRWNGSNWIALDDPRTATNVAAISSEVTARANADSALSQRIDTLSSTVDGQTSNITFALSAVNGIKAGASLVANANGKITGFKVNSDAAESTFDILASRFRIIDPNNANTNLVPFRVENGNIYMNNAMIKDLNVGSLNTGIFSGVMSVGSNKVNIDGSNGRILISD
ncbi:hypothetical protein D3C72_680500 [compost metagenome]